MNTPPEFLTAPWVEPLGRTLLHFLWQGAALGVLAWAALRIAHRRSAKVRYALAGILMLALPIAPVVTFLILSNPASIPNQGITISYAPQIQESMEAGPGGPQISLNVVNAEKLTLNTPTPQSRVVQSMRLAAWWMVPFWFAGIVCMALRLSWGWLRIQRWQRSAKPTSDAALLASFRRLAEKYKLGARIRLLISSKIPGPVTYGWVRPAVLLPAQMLTGLPMEILEALLAHELAHIARQDYLANLLQSAIEVVLFYHPTVWWLGARVREIREECCDELAVQASGDRLTYARALESLAELQFSAEPAPAANSGNLLARINRIVGRAPEAAGSSALGTLLFLVTAGAFVACLAAAPSQAQDNAPPPKQETKANSQKEISTTRTTNSGIVLPLAVTPAYQPWQLVYGAWRDPKVPQSLLNLAEPVPVGAVLQPELSNEPFDPTSELYRGTPFDLLTSPTIFSKTSAPKIFGSDETLTPSEKTTSHEETGKLVKNWFGNLSSYDTTATLDIGHSPSSSGGVRWALQSVKNKSSKATQVPSTSGTLSFGPQSPGLVFLKGSTSPKETGQTKQDSFESKTSPPLDPSTTTPSQNPPNAAPPATTSAKNSSGHFILDTPTVELGLGTQSSEAYVEAYNALSQENPTWGIGRAVELSSGYILWYPSRTEPKQAAITGDPDQSEQRPIKSAAPSTTAPSSPVPTPANATSSIDTTGKKEIARFFAMDLAGEYAFTFRDGQKIPVTLGSPSVMVSVN